jgi:SAM-dependent methyltransferase
VTNCLPAERKPVGPLDWIRDTFKERGLLGGLCYYVAGGFDLLRDLAPARRKARYGDIDYDFDHRVDTTWATVSLRTRIRELLSGGQYQPSEPNLFHQILQSLPVTGEGFTFIDLGSGKGRTLLMASDYPFRRIIGVELLTELKDIAAANIARYHSVTQRCFNIETYSADARHFQFSADATILYLFNPFPEHILREVLANLKESVLTSPREIYVIYHNLVHENVFREQTWLRELRRTHQYATYQAVV